MRKSEQDRQVSGHRLSSLAAYLLSLILNSTLGFFGQLTLVFPYFVARDWLAKRGAVSPGIPFYHGYFAAVLGGILLVFAFAAIFAASNFAVLRYSSVLRRPYWSSAVLVTMVSSTVQFIWNYGSLHS